jgi:hypothetical protein
VEIDLPGLTATRLAELASITRSERQFFVQPNGSAVEVGRELVPNISRDVRNFRGR